MEVLLVAFHYPPEISGGVARSLALEDYFVRRGDRVRVLTPQPIDRAQRGGELLSVPLPGLLAAPPSDAGGAPRASRNPLRRFARRWVFVPDGFVLWVRRAIREVAESADATPFDLVVTTAPPESMHRVGAFLKRRSGCAWLADFRDGWTFEPHRAEARLPLRRAVEKRLEANVVERADWVTAATLPIAEDLQARFPAKRDAIHCLPTGFTKPETGEVAPPPDRFELVYTGRMSLSRGTSAPQVFFSGLVRALAEDADFARAFRLTLLGRFTDDERAIWSQSPLADVVQELAECDYVGAQRVAAGATMLLLLTPPNQRSIATRKLFDYLAVERPVFALARGNEAARILESTGAGACVPSDDPAAVADGLLSAFAAWRDGRLDREYPRDGNHRFETGALFEDVLGQRVLAGISPAP